MIKLLRSGDEVVFKSFLSLKKTTRQLLKIVKELAAMGVSISSLGDALHIKPKGPEANAILVIFSAGNENFREWKGRRPKGWFRSEATIKKAKKLLEEGKYSKEEIAKKLDISLVTLYRYAKINLPE